ncbi:S28 family serine protease [Actinocorallia longicatena]|uniref:S28 family serine protease n=1 Tax=Actinocorallia longicatena TaxID=111803 RepID=A0ABP6Q902_9ACTN
MRRFRALTTAFVLAGALVQALPAQAAAPPDIAERLKAIPGMTVEEKPSTLAGYRWFWLNYRQPVDHRHPERAWFEQRIMLEHKAEDLPMILYTSGYNTPEYMFRSEPMTLTGGNQISVEYRYFTPSRPEPADWKKDTIWQAATDEHRLIKALKTVYGAKWISTGGSKGGMTATYHRRFYPGDVDGSVVYVAPNDVVNKEDSAYDRFLQRVGTDTSCRDHLRGLQKAFLENRAPLEAKIKAAADADGQTFAQMRTVDIAFENSVMDFEWAYWQYNLEADCASLPDPATATVDELYDTIDAIVGALGYTDQSLAPYVPYYYQAGTQLGWPAPKFRHLKGLLRHEETYVPRTYVPAEIPMRFEPLAMLDIDTWVKRHGSRLMFLYGGNDPWGAEPFRLGAGSRDSSVYTVAGMYHSGRLISLLPDAQRGKATADLYRWAGVTAPPAQLKASLTDIDPLTQERPRL